MLEQINIKDNSIVPKYQQIVNQLLVLIEEGKIETGYNLPAINTAYLELNVSRDTLIAAYKELQKLGVVKAHHGKGFFVIKNKSVKIKRVFILFDVMNGYKAILYQSLIENLGNKYHCDIFFHYYNLTLFEKIIEDNIHNYDYYLVMPHFNLDVSEIVAKIPSSKLILIDKDIPSLSANVIRVYQDFENDIYTVLSANLATLKKYSLLYLITNQKFQFIPSGIKKGFKRFCNEYSIKSATLETIKSTSIKKGNAYILFTDQDLVNVIRYSNQHKLKIGKDVGILSYDDTPVKEVLAGGITVLTTDFKKMGKTAAEFIKNNKIATIANPFLMIKRKSF